MDKNAIKKFAVWARRELIEKVAQKAMQFGIEEGKELDSKLDSINGVLLTDIEKKQRNALIHKIKTEGYNQVIEDVAYTWFNRFIALRFMEVNEYLPSHVRVFTNEKNAFKPQILDEALHLDYNCIDKEKVIEMKQHNQDEELYKYLLIVQCNELNKSLPIMFQEISDYTELLLPDYLLRKGSVIEQLIVQIPQEDWKDQVQIIGWLYQYYISEPKDTLINAKKQYQSGDVPFVTQIFTSEWIVKYMVQNSLGRLWTNITNNSSNDYDWDYYLEGERGTVDSSQNNLSELKIIDPCMGSGHIIVDVFDCLIKFYEERGCTAREASEYILENNIYGMDISERAYQLSYFSLMMKARQYNRNILNKRITPNLYLLDKMDLFDDGLIKFISNGNDEIEKVLRYVSEQSINYGEYGSLVTTEQYNYSLLRDRILEISKTDYDDIVSLGYKMVAVGKVLKANDICEVLSNKYDCVITNPPYIGNKFLPASLRGYIEANYKKYKSDIFSAFIVRIIDMCKQNGHIGMLTPYVWMFISTYEDLRKYVLENTTISSLVQLEYNAFEAACVPVCSFTLQKTSSSYEGEYVRLSEFRGAEIQGVKVKEAVQNPSCGYRYSMHQKEYNLIPGAPIAYWVDKSIINCFSKGKRVDTFAFPKQGLATADNNRFLRLWFEIDINKAGLFMSSREEATKSGLKWFPYNKGGGFKKWYGNNEYLVNWENDGFEICNFKDDKGKLKSRPQNLEWFFKQGLSWCKITSSSFSMRYIPQGFLFDVAGCTLFVEEKDINYILGFMNSKMNAYILALISPTLNFEVGHIGSLPIIFSEDYRNEIERLVKENINLCKNDWDSCESSWDFKINSLVKKGQGLLSDIHKRYSYDKETDFQKLKDNEEKLNEIFFSIYGANGILSSKVADDEVIIGRANYIDDVKKLISYAVGCMFGRYSLDMEGLIYAGGNWDKSKYKSFVPDEDAIIPICDEEYFEDDIVGRFVEFIKVAFGENNLEDNLRFVSNALGYEGTSREVIRKYFVNDFFVDHCNLYTSRGAGKRPIYWLFDSGKNNGFKCLIYMHRYQYDTIARIRTDYVHEQQARYRTAIEETTNRIESATGSDKVKLTKKLNTLKSQNDEIHVYEEKIHHLADQMINIDLDDGVKKNYEIFKDVLAKIK